MNLRAAKDNLTRAEEAAVAGQRTEAYTHFHAYAAKHAGEPMNARAETLYAVLLISDFHNEVVLP